MAIAVRPMSVILCLLILGVTVSALPANTDTRQPARRNSDVIQRISDLQAEVELIVQTIAKLAVVTEVAAFIEILVIKFNSCAELITEIGRNVDMDPSTKRDIVVKVTTIITLLFNISLELVARFGVKLAFPLLAEIDTCILTLLALLNACAGDSISTIPMMLGSSVFAQTYLKLSASALDANSF
ncbi:hypothetical protein RSOLAG22IIIB_10315 [Rhizoctonia solani]|uniref:Transmembrane protein n=1 Tax=Rhizoctonia solani TaxID=456999 RepID=A0A0K6G3I6_9AGAM|nr:unnamed protein product [Rhizoctonia solani]CUA72812.1 hypothetical protein RSOLAG22IIIB_10315 [Rhizoctonia solani]